MLILSPLTDKLFNRPVHVYSWAGFGLSILAVGIAIASVSEYTLSGLVLLNLFCYLGGYVFRLQFITRCAKDVDESVNRKFLVEEITVAMAVFLLAPGILALLEIGDAGRDLRYG